jgi:hypothetical protein
MIFFYFQPKGLVPYYPNNVLKKSNQSNYRNCKIITIDGEWKVFGGVPKLLLILWNSIEIRWIDLQYAKV